MKIDFLSIILLPYWKKHISNLLKSFMLALFANFEVKGARNESKIRERKKLHKHESE